MATFFVLGMVTMEMNKVLFTLQFSLFPATIGGGHWRPTLVNRESRVQNIRLIQPKHNVLTFVGKLLLFLFYFGFVFYYSFHHIYLLSFQFIYVFICLFLLIDWNKQAMIFFFWWGDPQIYIAAVFTCV